MAHVIIVGVDDITLGRALRAIRHQRNWTQAELSRRSRVAQSVISRAERGQIDGLSVRALRAICAALEVRLRFTPSWRGGELDRLLDEGHAAVTMRTVRLMRRYGWLVAIEVTFSHFGERGSIDVLGVRPRERAAVVNECKTDLTSTEELNRSLDRKVRRVADIVEERYGWRPRTVGRLVVFADTTTNRRRVAAHPVLDAAYPARLQEVRSWLREPAGALAGLVFLSVSPAGTGMASPLSRKRVRMSKSSVRQAAPRVPGAPETVYQPGERSVDPIAPPRPRTSRDSDTRS